jgi:hypothetical protein
MYCRSLDYRLGWPTPTDFVSRIGRADKCDDTKMLGDHAVLLANYILELAAIDHRLARSVPSLLAAGAYYIARIMIVIKYWSEQHILCFR